MRAIGVLAVVLSVAAVAVVLGGLGYLAFRLRGGETLRVSLRLPLHLYMHAGVIAGLVLLCVGGAGLIRAGLGAGLGNEFSYYPVHIPVAPEKPPEPARPPGASPAAPVPAEQPTEEERREMRQKGLDRALREGLLNGISYTVVGAIIWGLHLVGKMRLETPAEREGLVHRLYMVLVVVIFGIIVLVNLPQAVFGILRYYVLEPLSELGQPYPPPGNNLAFAIVSLPVWVTYLFGAIQALRRGQGEAL